MDYLRVADLAVVGVGVAAAVVEERVAVVGEGIVADAVEEFDRSEDQGHRIHRIVEAVSGPKRPRLRDPRELVGVGLERGRQQINLSLLRLGK